MDSEHVFATIASWDVLVWIWNFSFQLGLIWMGAWILMSSQLVWHEVVQSNTLIFLSNFVIGLSNGGKNIYGTFIELGHSVEHLDLLRCFGYYHFDYDLYFLRNMCFFFFRKNPKIIQKQTMNSHFFGLKLMPSFLHLRKHFMSFSIWVDRSLKIV